MSNDDRCKGLGTELAQLQKQLANLSQNAAPVQRKTLQDRINGLVMERRKLGCPPLPADPSSSTPQQSECTSIARQLAFLRGELAKIRPTFDPETRGANIKAQIAMLEQEQQDLGCIKPARPEKTLAATLTGKATIWTDSSIFPGPKTEDVTMPLTFEEWPQGWRVVVAQLTLPTFGKNPPVVVTIKGASGDFTPFHPFPLLRRMAMDLVLSLNVNVQFGAGFSGDTTIDASTGNTIFPPSGAIRGSIDGSGNVILVGQGQLSIATISANALLEIQGTLSDFPKST